MPVSDFPPISRQRSPRVSRFWPGSSTHVLLLGVALSAGAGCERPDGDGTHTLSCCATDPAPPVGTTTSASSAGGMTREERAYAVPDVELVDQHGSAVHLAEELSRGPLALNFIFTTCPTICPVMSATYYNLERELKEDAKGLRLYSITLDPQIDTPRALKAYAARYGSPPNWRLLTGNPETLRQVYKAFGAYVLSKASHKPFTLLRPAGAGAWVRLDGLLGAAQLAAECRKALVAP